MATKKRTALNTRNENIEFIESLRNDTVDSVPVDLVLSAYAPASRKRAILQLAKLCNVYVDPTQKKQRIKVNKLVPFLLKASSNQAKLVSRIQEEIGMKLTAKQREKLGQLGLFDHTAAPEGAAAVRDEDYISPPPPSSDAHMKQVAEHLGALVGLFNKFTAGLSEPQADVIRLGPVSLLIRNADADRTMSATGITKKYKVTLEAVRLTAIALNIIGDPAWGTWITHTYNAEPMSRSWRFNEDAQKKIIECISMDIDPSQVTPVGKGTDSKLSYMYSDAQ